METSWLPRRPSCPPGGHLVPRRPSCRHPSLSRRASVLGVVIADIISDVTVTALELAQGPAAVADALAEPPVLGSRRLEARAQCVQRLQRLSRPRQLPLRPR